MNTAALAPHVIVIGVDGVRFDSLQEAHTPNIDRIASDGFCVPVRVDARNVTDSGPVWATVATGVYADRHGVTYNDLSNNRFVEFPDFLTRVHEARPSLTTMAAASWKPLLTREEGGPIFAAGGYRPHLEQDPEDGTLGAFADMDESVIGHAARKLLSEDPAASFVYLVLADEVGHALGVTQQYLDAITRCDQQIGVLCAAIAARATRAAEEWTIIVVTDHGHRDEGNHGGDSDAERIAWIAADGPGLDADTGSRGVDHADIFSHVLDIFDIALQPGWRIEGVPFGHRALRMG